MILGIGVDIIQISAFAAQLDDPASCFLEGTFTAQEIETSQQRSKNSARHFAARFAAKEAAIKAWSTALWGRPPVLTHLDMRQIEVFQDLYQRPKLRVSGEVAQKLKQIGNYRFHLSLSHDGDYATAYVILEKFDGDKS